MATTTQKRTKVLNATALHVLNNARIAATDIADLNAVSVHSKATRIDVGCDADVSKSVTIVVTVPLPVSFDDLGAAIDDTADSLASLLCEQHLSGWEASNVNGYVFTGSIKL